MKPSPPDLGGRRLFTAPDVSGTVKPITAREVNSFIAAASGADVSAKDFRTFRASAEALALLAEQENGTEKLRKEAIILAAERASEIP